MTSYWRPYAEPTCAYSYSHADGKSTNQNENETGNGADGSTDGSIVFDGKHLGRGKDGAGAGAGAGARAVRLKTRADVNMPTHS